MSSKLHGLVWECDIQPISRKAVLARLADFSSDDGYCWPSVDTIRRQIGAKSKNTVTSATKALEAEGWLQIIPRKIGGRDTSNAYQLNVEKIEAAADEARDAAKQERRKGKSKFNPSDFDPPKIEGSKKDDLGGQNLGGEGSTIDPDPSLEPTTDPSDKKIFCPVAAQPDAEVLITDQAKRVLTHLNQVTGSRYQVCNSSMENIRARLRENFSPEELMLVVDYKNEDWRGSDQEQYLRPATLFIPKNFPGYLKRAANWNKAGRPLKQGGKWVQEDVCFKSSYSDVEYTAPEGFRS